MKNVKLQFGFKLFIICILFTLCFSSSKLIYSQNNYSCGNDAYQTEYSLGYNNVTIQNGDSVYIFDSIYNVYRCGNFILIPDKIQTENGNYTDINTFWGFGLGGTISNNSFTWDNVSSLDTGTFNAVNLFVSPISDAGITYSSAMQHNSQFCYYDSCLAIIDGPVADLIYPDFQPSCDTFNIWTGEELIDAGDLKNTGLTQKVSQQQGKASANTSYCVNKYGDGWRLPTDMELGHFNDNEGIDNGLDSAYMTTNALYLWSSSLFKSYAVKRWAVKSTDGYWENCGGFLYVYNFVRCVYKPKPYSPVSIDLNNDNDIHIKIYPNPVFETLYFENAGNSKVEVLNIQGQILLSEFISQNGSIDFSIFKEGLYLLKVNTNEGTTVYKILKRRNINSL